MILQSNPMFPEPGKKYALLASGLTRVMGALENVRNSVVRQKEIATKMATANSDHDIEKLLRQLDEIADSALVAGEKALDGRFSRGSRTGSMWIRTGLYYGDRERIFLETAGSVGLVYEHQPYEVNNEVHSSFLNQNANGKIKLLRKFGETLERVAAHVSGYLSRFGYVKLLHELLARKAGPELPHLMREPVAGQKTLMRTLITALDVLTLLLNRIREQAQEAAKAANPTIQQFCQMKVYQFIDEVNRIASQVDFNHLFPLEGKYSRTSRVGSMWFLFPDSPNIRRQIFIENMNGHALNLQSEFWVSQISPGIQPKLNDALQYIAKQKREAQEISAALDKTREINRKITLGKD